MRDEKVKLSKILTSTMASFLYPQVAVLIFLPFVISVSAVIFGLWLTWDFWMSYFVSGPLALQPYWMWMNTNSPEFFHSTLNFLSAVAPWALFIVLLALAFPIVIVLNLVIVSALAGTYLVKFIARKDYPDVQTRGHSRFVEGLWNSVSSSVLYLGLWLLTLPLWLIPGVGLFLPILLTAWLNQRVCGFDALSDFANDDEMDRPQEPGFNVDYILGIMTAFLNYIPFAFFIAPVMTMTAFIHLNLNRLQVARAQGDGKSPIDSL